SAIGSSTPSRRAMRTSRKVLSRLHSLCVNCSAWRRLSCDSQVNVEIRNGVPCFIGGNLYLVSRCCPHVNQRHVRHGLIEEGKTVPMEPVMYRFIHRA